MATIGANDSAMLATLRIKNLALVTDLTLELQPGFNAITGETGAGKSIIIGALNLVLGERADRTLIRADCESCSVEAVFETKKLRGPLGKFLDENGLEPCAENQLIIKRIFSSSGSNRQFINGSPTTLNVLAALGQQLVDMHGPHEHQSLFDAAKQLFILDAFGNLNPLRQKFAEILQHCKSIEAEKSALIVDEKTYAQQLDLLRFQVKEISAARLQPNEELEIDGEYKRASNAAKILELCQNTLGVLSENENSILSQAGALGRALHELQKIDAGTEPILKLQNDASQNLRELQNEISHYADKIDLNPARLRELEERLNLIHSLKRKYGGTLAEVIAFGEEAGKKLQSLEQRDAELARLNGELKKLSVQLWRAGEELSTQRRKIIPKLAKAVVKQLDNLGFQQSHFDVAISTLDLKKMESSAEESPISNLQNRITASGLDEIEFQFAPNPGEPARALRVIASSGEISRVMLALKTVLATEDEIPVLCFDEIDANVGGETAHAVGEKMRQIAQQRQVLCITHLPAVAASATSHFVVTKRIEEGRTISEIKEVVKAERVAEIARMLGGQTEAARRHAQSLLKG